MLAKRASSLQELEFTGPEGPEILVCKILFSEISDTLIISFSVLIKLLNFGMVKNKNKNFSANMNDQKGH